MQDAIWIYQECETGLAENGVSTKIAISSYAK
jgi:hypothetical protein